MALVLVATADGDLRAALRAALQRRGYTVAGADDGRRALNALVTSTRPVVGLLDDALPIFGGLQLLSYLRLLPGDCPHHAIVLLASNYGVVRALVEAGHDSSSVRVVLKPFALDSLLDAVDYAAGRLEGNRGRVNGTASPERRADAGLFDEPPFHASDR
jgi:CheY-like chemotaxis protein